MIVHHSRVWPSEPIVIGSGDITLDPTFQKQQEESLLPYGNPPLESNMSYAVFAIVQSAVNGSAEQAIIATVVLPTPSPIQGAHADLQTSESTSAIVGGILGVLLLMAIAFALVLLIYSRGWCKFGKKHGDYSLRKYPLDFPVILSGSPKMERSQLLPNSHAWWSVPVDVREPRYLIVDPDQGPNSTLVGTWSKNELSETFAREFASIPVGYKYPHSVGNAKENMVKNRVQTVLPYNHNRVILKRPTDSTETDYINASFIDGYMRRRAYIAAQSPFDTPTASDFWSMIFQRNCTQIVMLTNLVEDGTLKCCQYWPDPPRHLNSKLDSSQTNSANCSQCFGNLTVQAVDIVSYAHFTVRQFQLIEVTSGVTQNVTQYHFHSWISPEENATKRKANGAVGSNLFPSGDEQKKQLIPMGNFFVNSSNIGGEFDLLAFIEFYYRVKTASRPEDGPVLVHCGTGLTRTGLYIAFDSLLQQATHERVVGVARFCAALCKSRANMFRSARHYMLLYDLLFEALVAGHSIVDLDVVSTYRILNQKNPKIGRSYLWEQWSMLHLYTPSPDPDVDLRTALSATNARRNRFVKNHDLLPAERWRPHFRTQLNSPDWTGYINAVYIDGMSLRDDIILTQTPCPYTMDEFWLLIDEEKISCIIDMEPFSYGSLDAVRYWPLRIGEVKNEPLFAGSSDDERDDVSGRQSDAEDAAAARSPWFQVAGGKLQICQVGSLTPVRLDPGARKRKSSNGIYRRRLLIRSRNASGSREKSRGREVLIFHYASDWNSVNQVPESRVSMVRLLEAVRLERGTGPLLVHCLDGATRSGLFAVSHLLAERMTRDHYVDLFHVIKAVKMRRRAVISSQEQLRFVYRLLAQWIKQTLAEPLAAWTARHNLNITAPGSTQNWQWPQLVGHLPPYVRAGIFTHSQLPALVADHSSVVATTGEQVADATELAVGSCPMLNSSNSLTEQCPSNTVTGKGAFPVPTLYRYFHDELLNQRSTYSLKFGHPVCPGAAGDFSEMNSWSAPSLDRFNP